MAVTCNFCEDHHCTSNNVGNCTSKKYCFTSVIVEQEDIIYKRGCVDNDITCEWLKRSMHKIEHVHLECCETNFCNGASFPELSINKNTNHSSQPWFITSSLILLFVFITASVVVYMYKKIINKKLNNDVTNSYTGEVDPVEKEYLNSDYRPEMKVTSPGDSTLREVIDESMTSGSGSGYPLLIQRTFAKQIDLMECIGKGRYGEVWRGVFHSEDVAVKIFFSRDEASWQREIEIYSTIMLKNDNILPFIGSDVTSVNSCTQLWLVTAYYELGSLFDFLNDHSLCLEDMFSVMISIVSGITHLHTEIFGTQGKSAIAHRDIKSKNILMKTPKTCCIADFGLAVTHKQTTGSLNIAFNYRVGTKRYMAPEVLDGTLNKQNFHSYTMADIYSLSLVLWEVIRRCEDETFSCLNYKVPYKDMVPSDPSFEDMRKVVCIEEHRPEISADLENHKVLGAITKIIRETWLTNPASRLTALKIKKSLIKLKDLIFNQEINELEHFKLSSV